MPANVKVQIKALVKAFDTYAAGAKPPAKKEVASAESTKPATAAPPSPSKTSSR